MHFESNQRVITEILELASDISANALQKELINYWLSPDAFIDKINAYINKQSSLKKSFFDTMVDLLTNRGDQWGDRYKQKLSTIIMQRIFDKPALINGPVIPTRLQSLAWEFTLSQFRTLATKTCGINCETSFSLQQMRVLNWMIGENKLDLYDLYGISEYQTLLIKFLQALSLMEVLNFQTEQPGQPLNIDTIFQLLHLKNPRLMIKNFILRHLLLHSDDEVLHSLIIQQHENDSYCDNAIFSKRYSYEDLSLVDEAIALGKMVSCRSIFTAKKTPPQEYFLLACATNQLTKPILQKAYDSFKDYSQLSLRFDDKNWQLCVLRGMEITVKNNAIDAFDCLISSDAHIDTASFEHSIKLIIQQEKWDFFGLWMQKITSRYYWTLFIQTSLKNNDTDRHFNLILPLIEKQSFPLASEQLYYFASSLPATIDRPLFMRLAKALLMLDKRGIGLLDYRDNHYVNQEKLNCWIQLIENVLSMTTQENLNDILPVFNDNIHLHLKQLLAQNWQSFLQNKSESTYRVCHFNGYPQQAVGNILLKQAADAEQWGIVLNLLQQPLHLFSYSKAIAPVLRQAAKVGQFSILFEFLQTRVNPEPCQRITQYSGFHIQHEDQEEILFLAIMAEEWDMVRRLRDGFAAIPSFDLGVFRKALQRAMNMAANPIHTNMGLYNTICHLKDDGGINQYDIKKALDDALSSNRDDILLQLLTIPHLDKAHIEMLFKRAITNKQWSIVLVFIQQKSENHIDKINIEWALDTVYSFVTGPHAVVSEKAFAVYQGLSQISGDNAPSPQKLAQIQHDINRRCSIMEHLLVGTSPQPARPHHSLAFFPERAGDTRQVSDTLHCSMIM